MTIVLVVGMVLAASPAAANGNSRPTCRGRPATIVGTSGADRLIGTRRADVIVGLRGNDYIAGRGGNDLICAGGGHDVVRAGSGHDSVFGGPGRDTISGGRGSDLIRGGGGRDSLDGGSGRDALFGGPKADVLYGRTGHDSLRGQSGRDRLLGGPGSDRLTGGGGSDHINGGTHRRQGDVLRFPRHERGVRVDLGRGRAWTKSGVETLRRVEHVDGTRGDDVLKGDARANKLNGGLGDDVIRGRGGNDHLSGLAATVFGGSGDDILDGDHLRGGPGEDLLWAHADETRRSASGGAGADLLMVHDGCWDPPCPDDVLRINGGEGRDLVHVHAIEEPARKYRLDLPAQRFTLSSHTIIVLGMEDVIGTDSDDEIIGTDGPNLLMGARGNDTVEGRAGDDVLLGGQRDIAGGNEFDDASDTLDGGAGTDTCHTSSPPHGAGPADTIGECEQVLGSPTFQ